MNEDLRRIPEEIVIAAYETVGQFTDNEARQEITRLQKAQPALLTFVMASTEDLSNDAQELGLYIFIVVNRMYESHFGKMLQNVGLKRVEKIRDANEAEMESLLGADDETLKEAAVSQMSRQPWVHKYITECLFDPEDDTLDLSEDEQGALLMVLRTVVDCLESSVQT
jgi:hypothetical protein